MNCLQFFVHTHKIKKNKKNKNKNKKNNFFGGLQGPFQGILKQNELPPIFRAHTQNKQN